MNENEFYVIILDGDEKNPDEWEYVVRRDTLQEIEEVKVYSSDDRRTKSKKDYAGEKIKPKTVINTDTGNPASGNIYKLTKKARRSMKKVRKA